MKQVLILGGAGYIGSRLTQVLNQTFIVDSIDISVSEDYYGLSREFISKYSVIILLAGHSSVKSCIGDICGPWLNNVTNFSNLLTKINNTQLLIYASSSSVYGNNPGVQHIEDIVDFTPINNYDLTKYALDQLAQLAIYGGANIIGLRFGTVNGWSPVLRTDIMINAMYDSAITQQHITVTNSHIKRAILGIEDLCAAVQRCIELPTPGIYNLSSFNSSVKQIAQIVSSKILVPVIDMGTTTNVYDFELDCTKFKDTFKFNFSDTTTTIVEGLITNYYNSTYHKRDTYVTYSRG